jgi:hypothetical protein
MGISRFSVMGGSVLSEGGEGSGGEVVSVWEGRGAVVLSVWSSVGAIPPPQALRDRSSARMSRIGSVRFIKFVLLE